MMVRDYQAEIDAAIHGAGAKTRERDRGLAEETAEARRAVEKWNGESAPEGMMAMLMMDWVPRTDAFRESLREKCRSLRPRDPLSVAFRCKNVDGNGEETRGGEEARGVRGGVGVIGDPLDPRGDNELRLFTARSVGLISEDPPCRCLLEWKFEYMKWEEGKWGIEDSIGAIVVHREWEGIPLPEGEGP